jgi:hypothetical protein
MGDGTGSCVMDRFRPITRRGEDAAGAAVDAVFNAVPIGAPIGLGFNPFVFIPGCIF